MPGKYVLDVLTKLLPPLNPEAGQHYRVRGAHFIFLCRPDGNITNKTYAISIHGRNTVDFGLLRKCLQVFGIPPEEFYKAIRER